MIRLLRRIRKSLIGKGNFSSYLLYAIGEILLVVVGILIALQINNWNEQRKRSALEKSTLMEIQESLDSDITTVEASVERQLGIKEKIVQLLSLLQSQPKENEAIKDLLIVPVQSFRLQLNSAAFDLMQDRGIDLISNTQLRKDIVFHFKYTQKDMDDRVFVWEDIRQDFANKYIDYLDPIIAENEFEEFNFDQEKWKTLDYDSFVSNPKIIAQIKHRVRRKMREVALVKQFIEKKKVLRDKIGEEIRIL